MSRGAKGVPCILGTRHSRPLEGTGSVASASTGQGKPSDPRERDVRTLRGPSDIQEVKLTGALEEGFEKQVMLGLFGQAYWLGERLGCLQLRPSRQP